jgi:hypothetical protein
MTTELWGICSSDSINHQLKWLNSSFCYGFMMKNPISEWSQEEKEKRREEEQKVRFSLCLHDSDESRDRQRSRNRQSFLKMYLTMHFHQKEVSFVSFHFIWFHLISKSDQHTISLQKRLFPATWWQTTIEQRYGNELRVIFWLALFEFWLKCSSRLCKPVNSCFVLWFQRYREVWKGK